MSGGRFGKGPALRQVQGNTFSELLPGGNLITAVLDRRLMTWSDRGGASRVLGDRWSEQCAAALAGWLEGERPIPGGGTYRLQAVARLDDDPRIAIQAGQHKLTNPDFVLYGHRLDGTPVLQAADAKFAVDTIKPAQVSAGALEALLAVEGGLVRAAVERTLGKTVEDHFELTRGVFLSPQSPLTDFYLPRVLSDPRQAVERADVLLLEVDVTAMFAGLAVTGVIGRLARLDRLPTTPRKNVLAAIYYFRCASACAWLWVEERTPLLTLQPTPEVDAESLLREVEQRGPGVGAAYELLETWFGDVERVGEARKALGAVASVPVSMKELRALVEAVRGEEDRRLVRLVRGALERTYRERLVELVGEVPAQPVEPLPAVLDRVARATRALRPELRAEAERLVHDGDT